MGKELLHLYGLVYFRQTLKANPKGAFHRLLAKEFTLLGWRLKVHEFLSAHKPSSLNQVDLPSSKDSINEH